MVYAALPGCELPASRLVLGCDKQRNFRQAARMFDEFFEHGGNAFDTAHIYGGGLQEKLLGRWLRKRGLREHVVIIGKGGHTPDCTPEGVTRQLDESLHRLQVGYVDLYLLHRDNPDVPVEDFVNVLNEHVRGGRMKAFGASNWTVDRVEAANQYAGFHGLKGIAATSNQFSLARMLSPLWPGCLSASDPATRSWHERTGMPLLAWSSQARGFFSDRAVPDRREDGALVSTWYSEENFARRTRAVALAAQRKVPPTSIALAYVLKQPFPTFAIIGPRTAEQLRTSLDHFSVKLSSEEVRWLEFGDANG